MGEEKGGSGKPEGEGRGHRRGREGIRKEENPNV